MINLIPIGEIDQTALESIIKPVTETFNQKVEVSMNLNLKKDSWHPRRQQYQADSILNSIPLPLPTNRHLGVLDVDLFAFGLNFVFGEADTKQKNALISIARLRPEFYKLPPDENVLRERILVEAVHELGHTYNLMHCPNIHCVMHFSQTIYDTDIKGWRFCAACQKRLSAMI